MSTQVLGAEQVPVQAGSSGFTDLSLSVSSPGQVLFNIFTEPAGNHELLVNGVTYFNNIEYEILNSSGWKVHWIGTFDLEMSDTVIFRKYN